MATEVEVGKFYGCTKAELDEIKAYHKAAVQGAAKLQSKSGDLVLSGSTVNGQSFAWALPAGVSSIEELQLALRDAYHQIDVTDGVTTDPGPAFILNKK